MIADFFARIAEGFATPAGLIVAGLVLLIALTAIARATRAAAASIGDEIAAPKTAAPTAAKAPAQARPTGLPQAA